MYFILAQVFALLSSTCLLISFWQKKRNKILFFQILDSTFDVLQYLLLGAYTGGAISLLGATRAYCFSKTTNKKFLYLFLGLYIVASLVTFDGAISLIPLLAALIYTIVVWNKKERNIRLYSIFVFILWLIYDVLVGAYVNAITDIVLIVSNIMAFNKIDRKVRNKEESNIIRIGKKVEGAIYKKRPGAYVIIERDEDNKIAIATDAIDVYFFLGGGIEENETEEEALKREVIEESGYSLKNVKLFDKVTSWCHTEANGYMDVEATVYIANFDKIITKSIEEDHEVIWVNPIEYKNKLYHEYQRYILNKYVCYKKGIDYEE